MKPELNRVWFNIVVGVELLLKPPRFPELGVQVQVKRVPDTWDVRVILVDALLQMLLVRGIFDRSGKGNMITLYLDVSPRQPKECGTI